MLNQIRKVLIGGEWATVTTYARAGIPPEWHPRGPEWKPALNRRGKPRVVYAAAGHAWLCKVAIITTPQHVARARAEYRTWWRGVRRLADSFISAPELLSAHSVSGFKAPGFPWHLPRLVKGA